MVFNSRKNVLLEFYEPWCGHCKKLAPILDEVAISFENDHDVVIAKLDANVNDIPSETFDVRGYPTLYFRSSSGNLLPYDGERTKEDRVEFIQKNGASHADLISTKSEAVDTDSFRMNYEEPVPAVAGSLWRLKQAFPGTGSAQRARTRRTCGKIQNPRTCMGRCWSEET